MTEKSRNIKKNKVIVYILIFLLIYFNNETLSNNLCNFANQPCQYVFVLICLYALITDFQRKIKSRVVMYVFLLVQLTIIAKYMDNGTTNGYILIILNIVSAFCMYILSPYDEFAYVFIRVMEVIAIASLLCTYALKPIVMSVCPTVTNSVGINFSNAILSYVVKIPDYYRNTGIFREAGVFGAFLCIATAMLMGSKTFTEKQNVRILIVYFLTLLTTFSTTCYVAMILIVIIAKLSGSGRNIKTKYIVIALLLCVVAIKYYDGSGEYVSVTMDKLDSSSSSYQYRLEPIINGIKIALERPWGYGIQNGIMALFKANTLRWYHNTSTYITALVYFGFLFFVLYTYGILRVSKFCLNNYLYFIPLTLILNGEQYIYNPIIYVLIIYGVATKMKADETSKLSDDAGGDKNENIRN